MFAKLDRENVWYGQDQGNTCEQRMLGMQVLDKVVVTVAKGQEDPAVRHGAQGHCHGAELDHDEPPDGKGEGQPDGHRVDHDGEVGVEQQENTPGK